MLLREFISQLDAIYQESRGTHHFNGEVEVDFILSDPDDVVDVEVELLPESDDPDDCPVQPHRMMGCGCWAGANVYLRIKRAKP